MRTDKGSGTRTGAGHHDRRGGEVEMGVEFAPAVGIDVGPEQRGQGLPVGVGEVVADERRTYRPPEFLDPPVGGVLGPPRVPNRLFRSRSWSSSSSVQTWIRFSGSRSCRTALLPVVMIGPTSPSAPQIRSRELLVTSPELRENRAVSPRCSELMCARTARSVPTWDHVEVMPLARTRTGPCCTSGWFGSIGSGLVGVVTAVQQTASVLEGDRLPGLSRRALTERGWPGQVAGPSPSGCADVRRAVWQALGRGPCEPCGPCWSRGGSAGP